MKNIKTYEKFNINESNNIFNYDIKNIIPDNDDSMTDYIRTEIIAKCIKSNYNLTIILDDLLNTGNFNLDIKFMCDGHYVTPTMCSIMIGNHIMLDYLINKGQDINSYTNVRENYTYWFAITKNIDIILYAIEKGANIIEKDDSIFNYINNDLIVEVPKGIKKTITKKRNELLQKLLDVFESYEFQKMVCEKYPQEASIELSKININEKIKDDYSHIFDGVDLGLL